MLVGGGKKKKREGVWKSWRGRRAVFDVPPKIKP